MMKRNCYSLGHLLLLLQQLYLLLEEDEKGLGEEVEAAGEVGVVARLPAMVLLTMTEGMMGI